MRKESAHLAGRPGRWAGAMMCRRGIAAAPAELGAQPSQRLASVRGIVMPAVEEPGPGDGNSGDTPLRSRRRRPRGLLCHRRDTPGRAAHDGFDTGPSYRRSPSSHLPSTISADECRARCRRNGQANTLLFVFPPFSLREV